MSNRNALGKTLLIGAAAAIVTALNLGTAFAAPFALKDEPLFLSEQPPPLNMLVMSRDHRMYYEAYNDASDLNNDGKLDVSYITDPNFKYYGYFSSDLCYSYGGGLFTPAGAASGKKCGGGSGGTWSGDWLNYVTMSRVDALRKVLYGGLRSTDTASDTVLQRAFIPQDAHSWGKEYGSVAENGYDITQYAAVDMPAAGTHHLFANTTPSGAGLTFGNPNPAINGVGLPLLRVLTNRNNRIWDWLSAERLVANNEIHSGASQGGVAPVDMVVRVQVCVGASPPADQQCKVYGTGKAKPTGLLQDYGENDRMLFGLLSGSYGNPHEGGVLRKAVSSLKNEIDLGTGVFYQNLTPPGIINTIDRLRITGFNYDQYACGWITTSSDAAGACSMWGNPTAEMMYEVVRYFGGKANASPAFAQGSLLEENSIGLGTATWNATTDPYKQFPHCSKPYETVISDINPSYDSNNVPGSGFAGSNVDDMATPVNARALGDLIWSKEMSGSGRYFIGESGGIYDGAPTVKTVGSFGNIRGLAPEGPTKEGSYMSGSVAYYAHINDLNTATGEQKLSTFAVALASPLPRIDIPVGGGHVTFVPFAKSVGGGYGISSAQGAYQPTNQIVDFYVESITPTSGSFRVNFEDVEQGADHDMDAIARYQYQVVGNQLDITVTSEYAAGGIIQHMGYVISGTTADGTYLEVRDLDTAPGSDVDYFLDTPPGQPPGGNWNDGQPLPAGVGSPAVRHFTAGSTAGAGFLKDPLYYAAKWGGFTENPSSTNNLPDQQSEWDADNDGIPDNYFLVTNAGNLKDQLAKAFSKAYQDAGSASSAAVSSGSISDDTHVYQATFMAKDWSGHIVAFPISDGDTNNNGVRGDPGDIAEGQVLPASWDAASLIPAAATRRIVTPTSALDGTLKVHNSAVPFVWNSLDATLQGELVVAPEGTNTVAQQRVDYLRGDRSNELPGGAFRPRSATSVLGDIVNSGPTFVGTPRSRYRDNLESRPYSGFRAANLNRTPTIYVGANDGMLHAFDANTGIERFGFVPRSVFANLSQLSNPNYTHKYYVDGTPSVGDAFFGNAWHTVLAAGLNKGGQGVYALDITNPGGMTTASAVANSFLWEFTDETDRDLGYTYARPTIARLKNGKWVAIFGNGYNNTDTRGGADTHVSATGNAVLYIVDVQTGELIRKIDTGIGTAQDPEGQSRPNGLSTPAVADLDGDSIADYAFAGDMFGNLWKFDLRSANPAGWVVAAGGAPLFQATNGTKSQPITDKPQVDIGPNGLGMIVLFGTGKFLEASDRDIAQSTTQTFYGIYDLNTGTGSDVVTRSDLVAQTILGETTTSLKGITVGARATSTNPVPKGKKGWYLDLGTATSPGEMVVTDPVLRNGRVLFTTLIPDDDPCAYGGRSWLMELNEYTGSRLDYSPFDFNNDKSFNSTDFITVNVGGSSMTIPASGVSRDAIMSRPAVVSGQSMDYGIMTDTSGNGLGVNGAGGGAVGANPDPGAIGLNAGPGAVGRQSWRQVR